MPYNFKLPLIIGAAAAIFAFNVALAQNAPNAISAPAQKSIGATKPEMVPSLIVMNARGATLQGDKLTLTGVSPNSIVFADRPVRAAGHAHTAHLIEEWGVGDESFAKDPPNATVSVLSTEGPTVNDVVVVLKSPKLEGDRLTFDVSVLEGDLKGATGPASVFIDIIGRPLTPMSYAGVARRTARRSAWYGYGAAVGAGAYAASPYYNPYYSSPYPYPYPYPYRYPY